MPLEITRNDIHKIQADAIVDPTDMLLSGSGSVDRLIHEKAGEGLKTALEGLCLEEGKALITESFDCDNCRYIIHTCGPVYEDGKNDEDEILRSCYRECLRLAHENELESVAFPLIASGSFMFPKGRALRIATDTITEFLLNNEMNVYLLVYDRESFDTASKLYSDIKNYINESRKKLKKVSSRKSVSHKEVDSAQICNEAHVKYSYDVAELEKHVFEPDESFSECLIRMIGEKGYTDPEVYKRANIDRKLFNHIINDRLYRPKKATACALAIGLRLNINETATLLERAGFILSGSSTFDLIVRYCIENEEYDIMKINEILYQYDQKLMGGA